MSRERLYHVVVINERTGRKVYMTKYPEPHDRALVLLSKLTRHPWRREQLEQACYPNG
jgi:hypothetical protein